MRRLASVPFAVDAAIASALAALQALLVSPLFAAGYTQWRGSIEAAFIADARFIDLHFPDLSWDPNWYLGFPFELFYTPLLQTATALLGLVSGDVASAYRVVAAAGLALGAAAIYAFARSLGLRRIVALVAAALFSCAPLASYLLPGLVADGAAVTGSALPLPWRLVVLVEYGEGPHVLGLSLALFAAAAVLAYLRTPTAVRFWSAAALLLAVALTNLIAVLGAAVFAAMAVLAIGEPRRIERGARLAATVAILSLVWYSPGFVKAVGGFSTPGGEGGGSAYLLFPVAIAAAAVVGRVLSRRSIAIAIAGSSALVFALILVAWYARGAALAPQPIRYALELDAMVAVVLALAVERLAAVAAARIASPLLARPERLVAGCAALVLLVSLPGWSSVHPRIAPDPSWQSWSERKVALWLDDHLAPGERAFLSGSHAFWADVFADVPQVRGGVDFAGLDPWWAHATYQIDSGSDARVSVQWLRALGVRYVVVTGPDSTDAYRDFAKPEMFEGILPRATTIDGARIYEVAAPHAAPRLIERAADPPPPSSALDGTTLARYLGAIDAGAPQTALELRPTGLGGWTGTIDTGGRAVTLLLPMAYDDGWKVYLEGRRVAARRDSAGLLAVDVSNGYWNVAIDHRVHPDLLAGNVLAFAFLSFVSWRSALRSRGARLAAPLAVIVGTVVVFALALGVVGGYPKGTDAPMHVARLRFVADWFPHDDWLYAWAGGMPAFDTYPVLPYLIALPFVRATGAPDTLELLALASFMALGLGLYGHLVERGRPRSLALVAALVAVTSLATWTWVLNGGAYTRVVAVGFGAVAWWAHARALRTDAAVWWVATAGLLAAAVASHPVIGAIPALYVVAVHLSARGRAGLPRLALLAGTSALLAAPALAPAVLSGGAGFLGQRHDHLEAVRPDMLWSPIHVGVAAFTLAVTVLVIELTRRPWRVVAAAAGLALVLLYAFAPALGIPTAVSYVAGIDPVTMTYAIALVGALVFAGLAPVEGRPRTLTTAFAAVLVVANLAVAVPAYAAQRAYPRIVDTTEPTAPEEIARRTLVVDDGDLAHRVLPLSAQEAVWFSATYRTPMLRHYYDQGVAHPDWLAWAFAALYAPPFDATRARVVADWYALSALTVGTDAPAEARLAALPWLTPVASTMSTPFHEYEVAGPSTIAVTTTAPLVAVVADRAGYDRIARLLFDDGATPATRIPAWWSGSLSDLPADLADHASAILVVGDRLGYAPEAARVAREAATRGANVVWDLAGVKDGPLPAPWPGATVAARAIPSFAITDRAGRIAATAFSPAAYGDAAWGAQVLSGAAATAELALGSDALVASTDVGTGSLTVVGGNLFYHALAYANAAERAYVLSFLGPPAGAASHDVERYFIDPDRREIATDGSPIVLKESIHPGWNAAWRGADGTVRPLPIRYAGPALMLVVPPGPGSVAFTYGSAPANTAGWLLFALGLLALAATAAGAGRLRLAAGGLRRRVLSVR
ncbi:MAG: hypothetical protein KGK34_02975 [Chloroflexota bacterium]|nr:hypothetical protein [Chloroflexota bacterium]